MNAFFCWNGEGAQRNERRLQTNQRPTNCQLEEHLTIFQHDSTTLTANFIRENAIDIFDSLADDIIHFDISDIITVFFRVALQRIHDNHQILCSDIASLPACQRAKMRQMLDSLFLFYLSIPQDYNVFHA